MNLKWHKLAFNCEQIWNLSKKSETSHMEPFIHKVPPNTPDWSWGSGDSENEALVWLDVRIIIPNPIGLPSRFPIDDCRRALERLRWWLADDFRRERESRRLDPGDVFGELLPLDDGPGETSFADSSPLEPLTLALAVADCSWWCASTSVPSGGGTRLLPGAADVLGLSVRIVCLEYSMFVCEYACLCHSRMIS